MCRLFFSFVLLVLLSVFVQNVRSSCRDFFGYIQDEGGIYGLITINYFGFVSSMIVRINFTIGARLASRQNIVNFLFLLGKSQGSEGETQWLNKFTVKTVIQDVDRSYTGSLQPIGSKMNLLRDYNRGKAMQYKVYFPVVSPLPRVTSITVNDKVLCYGQGDVIGQVQYVTTISLQYRLFYQPGNNEIYNRNPQIEPEPAFHNYNDINPYIIENSEPYIIEKPEAFVPQPQTTSPIPEYFVTTRPQTTKKPVPKPSRPKQDRFSTQVEFQTTTRCGINSRNEQPIAAPLIYNGVTYDPGEWPWLVAMYQLRFGSLNYICAGTLVSPTHVVSAAHCIYRKNKYTHKKNVVIRAGIYSLEDWNDNIVTRSLKELHIHDSYNSSTLENDILIMTLKSAVTFTAMIQPACLWSGSAILDEIVGKSGVVAGWGDNEHGSGGKGIPRMVTMPVVSTDDCRASNSDFHKLTSSKTLCAGERAGSGPCLGDSGGGLYFLHQGRWRLRGIVSLALVSNEPSQCDLNQYIVFTDTAQYLPWISSVMSIT